MECSVVHSERKSALDNHDRIGLPAAQQHICDWVPATAKLLTMTKRQSPDTAEAKSITIVKIGVRNPLGNNLACERVIRQQRLVRIIVRHVRQRMTPCISRQEIDPMRHFLARACLQGIVERPEAFHAQPKISELRIGRLNLSE